MKILGSILSLFLVFFLFQNCGNGGSSLGDTTVLSSLTTDDVDFEEETEVQFTPIVRLFDVTTYEGEPLLLQILVESNQYEKLSYNWYKNGQLITGTVGSEIDIFNAVIDDGGQYKVDVIYTDVDGNTRVLYSDQATIDIRPDSERPAVPTFTFQPVDTNVREGDRLILQAGVVGIPQPTVQWFKDNVEIPRATNAVLTIATTQLGDAGTYQAVATNNLGSVNSNFAVVTVTNLQCTMPNGTVADVGSSYSTRCRPNMAPNCTAALLGPQILPGTSTTHTCGAGGQVQSSNSSCFVTISASNCGNF